MEQAAGLAREISGADVIDINMGCPVGKVAGNGDGSALMRDPDKARKIIEAVVRGAGVPVTVKFRKGWDKGNVNAVEFGRMCEEAGASAITVHGRTRTQMYSGVADWDIIRDVKKAVSIPVFANGDVFEPGDAPHILRYTGCDMYVVSFIFMIVCAVVLPVALAVIFCVRGEENWKPLLFGALTYIFFQVLLRFPLLQMLFPQYSWFSGFSAANPALYALFLGGTAALFEEGGRFAVISLFLRKQRTTADGIAFGVGHGGMFSYSASAFTKVSISPVSASSANLNAIPSFILIT